MLNTWQISISTFYYAHWIIKFSVRHKNNKKTSLIADKDRQFEIIHPRRVRHTIRPKTWLLWSPDKWSRKKICTSLHKLTGVEQRITSGYHPQSNDLVERKSRTVLGSNPEEWPHITEGVFFSHRVRRHSSTKYSPDF